MSTTPTPHNSQDATRQSRLLAFGFPHWLGGDFVRRAFVAAIIGISLFHMFEPGLAEHVRLSADPYRFNDDSRQQIAPFLRYIDEGLPQDDYITNYYLSCIPKGFSLFYRAASWLGDPRGFSKLTPYLLLVGMGMALAATASRLGGGAAVWGSLALCLTSGALFARMTGGLPRSFAYPLVALMACGLVRGRPHLIAVATVLAAAFYYPMAVFGGILLFLSLFGLPASWQGESATWNVGRRAGTLAATGMLVVLLALPSLIATRAYGPMLGPNDVATYPEAGVGGRYGPMDIANVIGFPFHFSAAAAKAFRSSRERPFHERLRAISAHYREWITWGLIAFVAIAMVPLARDNLAIRRLLLLPAAGVLGFFASGMLAPRLFIAERYLIYSLPLFLYLALPPSFAMAGRSLPALGRWRHAGSATAIVGSAVLVLVMGARGPSSVGFPVVIRGPERPIIHYLSKLKGPVLIAGWPDGIVDNVPYLTAKPVLINLETHQAFHRDYVLEMRRRMTALIAAYFANDPEPLIRLREDFGVTHLVIDRRHYSESPPHYFEPFEAPTQLAARSVIGVPETLRQESAAGVAVSHHHLILDLRLISPGPTEQLVLRGPTVR